jgi:hypothetical protein
MPLARPLWMACGALALACASPGMPPGGPPDDAVPRITRISPDSNALNANVDAVLIHFDEVISERPTAGGGRPGAVVAGNPAAAGLAGIVSISPSDGTERVNWRRTAIEIEPRRGFRANTAYRVVVEPGVTDLRGNVLGERIEFVFSTGGALPAGLVSGVVFDWAGAKAASHARVEAFVPTDSTLRWTTTADTLGRFAVRDLVPGTYVVRGWIDANNSRTRDFNEPFARDTVTVDSIARAELYAFLQDTLAPRVEAVEFADSLTLRVRFDRAVVAEWDGVDAAELVGADSTPRGVGTMVPMARLDSLRTAARDTAAIDTIGADTVRTDTVPARDTLALSPDAPRFGRPAPVETWALPLDAALTPGLYRLTIRGARGLNGFARETQREFTVRAPVPRPASDTTAATTADTTAARPR